MIREHLATLNPMRSLEQGYGSVSLFFVLCVKIEFPAPLKMLKEPS